MRKCVVITGGVRNGSSCVAGSLQLCGLYLGRPDNIYGGDRLNKKGYFENRSILRGNDKVLNVIGYKWQTMRPIDKSQQDKMYSNGMEIIQHRLGVEFPDRELFGIKDVRIGRILPVYKRVLEEMGIGLQVILLRRDYKKSYTSLRRMRRFHHGHYKALPEFLFNEALNNVQQLGTDYLITRFEDVLDCPGCSIGLLCDFIGLQFNSEVKRFVDKGLVTQ